MDITIERYKLILEKSITDIDGNEIKKSEPIVLLATNMLSPIQTTYPKEVYEDEIVNDLCDKMKEEVSKTVL